MTKKIKKYSPSELDKMKAADKDAKKPRSAAEVRKAMYGSKE